MRDLEKRTQFSRRGFLRTTAAAVPAAAAAAAGMSISATSAWAQAAKNLKPDTKATLAKVARDIYPHDRLADVYYMTAVGSYDSADAPVRVVIEEGIAALDAASMAKHGTVYLEVNWEDDRVAMLRGMQDGAFFNKLRGDLVVSLYNQQPVWAKFGYEGSSADKGGYLHRGFNDLDWLSES
jgi:hypothetical protein